MDGLVSGVAVMGSTTIAGCIGIAGARRGWRLRKTMGVALVAAPAWVAIVHLIAAALGVL